MGLRDKQDLAGVSEAVGYRVTYGILLWVTGTL